MQGALDDRSHPFSKRRNTPATTLVQIGVLQLFPLGGPMTGGTTVTVSGVGFSDLGDIRCRFGVDTVRAALSNSSTELIECTAPPCRSPTCLGLGMEGARRTAVPLEVTVDGVSYTR